ncbi:hypothetical protein P8452_56932 [Trifolium repens]|nr:hypothetical protein P8452_56932 [Trifolium repens]
MFRSVDSSRKLKLILLPKVTNPNSFSCSLEKDEDTRFIQRKRPHSKRTQFFPFFLKFILARSRLLQDDGNWETKRVLFYFIALKLEYTFNEVLFP